MKILVINSPLFRFKNERYDEDSLPPIGLGLIATALKNEGYKVDLLDAVALNIPLMKLIDLVSSLKPDIICTNVFTTNLELVKEFIESIHFTTRFIVGGLSTNSLYSEIFNLLTDNHIDVIHGDGELITPDIIKDKVTQKATYVGENRRFFKIDNTSQYYVYNISNEKLDRSFFVNEPVMHPFGFTEANIVTSRGCIYNCAFCAAATSISRELGTREKSIDSVISEVKHLLKIYPSVQSIRILDDLFLKNAASVNRAIEIFKNFKLQWRSMAHVQTFRNVEDNTIKQLKDAGCNELFIGIESGSSKILKQIHKSTNIEDIKENLSKLLRNGINVKGYFIYGFPGETRSDFMMTYELAEYLKNVSVEFGTKFRTSVFQFRPYHGTELYHDLESQFGDKTFNKVSAIEPNDKLSELIGRLQFNFHSGNYSDEDIDTVREFIYKTTNLNSVSLLFPNE